MGSGLEACEPDEEGHPVYKIGKPDEINP